MKWGRHFVTRHRMLAGVAGLFAVLVPDAKGDVGVTLLADVPTNEDKLHAAAVPTVAPGPNDRGQTPTFLLPDLPHLAHEERPPNRDEMDRINGALREFQPDVLVVEQLPPDWPLRRSRDYRPDLNLDRSAEDWGLSRSTGSVSSTDISVRGPPRD